MADRCYIQKRVLNATKVRTFKPSLYLVCRRMQQSTVRPVVPTAIAVTATRWLVVKGVFCLDSLHLLRLVTTVLFALLVLVSGSCSVGA